MKDTCALLLRGLPRNQRDIWLYSRGVPEHVRRQARDEVSAGAVLRSAQRALEKDECYAEKTLFKAVVGLSCALLLGAWRTTRGTSSTSRKAGMGACPGRRKMRSAQA